MSLKIYFDLMSQPSRAVWLFVKLNKIPHQECAVALRKGEHMTDEFRQINPNMKVPAIDHNGFLLSESIAIMRYLSHEYKTPDHWYPADARKRARVDEFMAWQHLNLRIFGSMYFRTRVLAGKPADDPKLLNYKDQLDGVLDQMEKVFLSQSNYINGASDVTIADLLAISELEQPIAAGYDVGKGRPVLSKYMKAVKDRLMPEYEQAIQVARKVGEMVAKGKL